MKRNYKVAAITWLTVAMGMSMAVYANKGPHMVVDKFKMMDTDKNGKLSSEEHQNGAAKMFSEADLNHDGNLTAEEMDAHHAEKMKKMDKKMKGKQHEEHQKMSSKDMIAKFDTNGDGVLTKAEHDAGAAKMFSDSDTDKDGVLSLGEMQAAHEKMMGDSTKH